MNSIKIVSLIGLVSLLSMNACKLERQSYNEIYPENFFRNEDDVNKALTALYYTPFKMGYGSYYGVDQYSYQVASDFTAGTMASRWLDAGGYPTYEEHRFEENYPAGYAKDFAERMYSRYNDLTAIQNTIKRIQESNVADDLKTKAIAEAKCLYAWEGFILYDLFGPVPLATEEALEKPYDKILIPRLSDEEYTKVMIDNLDEAIAGGLPVRQDADWGRASKGLALMIKLKFLMTNKNYTDAESVARELYSYRGSVYDLVTSGYKNVFTKAGVKNQEIIHAIPCGLADGMQNRWMVQFYPVRYAQNLQCWFNLGMDWRFYDTFEKGDDRLNSVVTEYTSITGEVNNRNSSFLKNAAAIVKVDDPEFTGEFCTTDLIVYRFADVMLSLAECINANSGPTQEAIGLVNEIRARAKLPALTPEKTAGKDAFNTAILNERLHEFMAEGLSRQDKIRFGTFVSDSKALYPNSQSAPHKTRFAIPSKYILESDGVVKQNPGYTTSAQ